MDQHLAKTILPEMGKNSDKMKSTSLTEVLFDDGVDEEANFIFSSTVFVFLLLFSVSEVTVAIRIAEVIFIAAARIDLGVSFHLLLEYCFASFSECFPRFCNKINIADSHVIALNNGFQINAFFFPCLYIVEK